VLLDSSPITVPSLLRKHTRSKGPSLHRHYPASSVVWPSPTPRLAAALSDDVRRRDPPANPEPPPLTQIAFPTCRAHYPGGPVQVLVGCRVAHSSAGILPLSVQPSPFLRRVGVHIFTFEACSSFTRVTACKVAHPPFVGFIARLRPSRFPGSDARKLPSSTNNLLGWVLPPLVICAFGAH
jgi:hypothetical protein